MISVRLETERETVLGGYVEVPNFIFMETMMMIELTRSQNQSQIVQSSGTSWMNMSKKLCSV